MFQPLFMQRFAEFDRERRSLTNVNDWIAFSRRWFNESGWPKKSAAQITEDSARKQGTLQLGGREWGYTSGVYDLSADARYEYAFTLHAIGDALRFPEAANGPKDAADGWCQECPYDEISTSELGDTTCPQCGRPLVYVNYAS